MIVNVIAPANSLEVIQCECLAGLQAFFKLPGRYDNVSPLSSLNLPSKLQHYALFFPLCSVVEKQAFANLALIYLKTLFSWILLLGQTFSRREWVEKPFTPAGAQDL